MISDKIKHRLIRVHMAICYVHMIVANIILDDTVRERMLSVTEEGVRALLPLDPLVVDGNDVDVWTLIDTHRLAVTGVLTELREMQKMGPVTYGVITSTLKGDTSS